MQGMLSFCHPSVEVSLLATTRPSLDYFSRLSLPTVRGFLKKVFAILSNITESISTLNTLD